MLHESKPRLIAERLLLLTEALFDAAANDRLDEVGGILQSRQVAINELDRLELDSFALAVLEKVRESEVNALAVMERTSAATANELVHMFKSTKKIRAYSKPSSSAFVRAS